MRVYSLIFFPKEFEPRHVLDLPPAWQWRMDRVEHDYDPVNGDRPPEQLLMSREDALEVAAKWNARTFANSQEPWAALIEFEPAYSWAMHVDLEGPRGFVSAAGIPFKLVKPTRAERAQYADRLRLATATA